MNGVFKKLRKRVRTHVHVCLRVQCFYVLAICTILRDGIAVSIYHQLKVTRQTNSPAIDKHQAWNMLAVFKAHSEREKSESVKDSIIPRPNREGFSTMALIKGQCQGELRL